jgi:uncharacterized surface protein with fasciclin (FAS1) repeats
MRGGMGRSSGSWHLAQPGGLMKPTKGTPRGERSGAPRNGRAKSARRSDGTASAHDSTSPYAPDRDLLGMASATDRLTTFAAAIRSAGLAGLLSSSGPFTIFAPTNRAFEKMPDEERDALLTNASRLAAVLCHHVVPGRVKAPKPESPRIVLPVSGAELTLTADRDAFHVNEARLVKTNIRGSNGVIHAIDTVLATR